MNNAFYIHDYQNSSIIYHNSALNLLHCVHVIITNITITVTPGTDGLVVVNAMMRSELNNVLVMLVNVLSQNSTAIINGLVVYYQNNKNNKQNIIGGNLHIHNFTYKQTVCLFKGSS